MSDDKPTIIHTGGSGSAGWAVAVILLILIGVGSLFLTGNLDFGGGSKSIDVDVNLPKVETPAEAPAE